MATAFPAFCPNCGLIFPSGISFGPNVGTITLARNKESCRDCGACADILEGTFRIEDDVIHVLAAAPITMQRLAALNAVLDRALTVDEAEAAAIVARDAPELEELWEKYSPAMGRALAWFLKAFVVALIAVFVNNHFSHSHTASKADLEQAFVQAVQACQQQPPPQGPTASWRARSSGTRP